MKRKLGTVSDCIRGGDTLETLEMIQEVGFECFGTGEYNPAKVSALVAKGNSLGINCEYIHASFKNINAMWTPGLEYLTVFNDMKKAIDAASENGVPAVVTHVSSGWHPPHVNDLGLSRYDDIVLYAKDKGVKLAFENLRKVGNLAVLIDRYENIDHVGFCYDNGHEHCYTETVCWPDMFREKILCTHLHDNYCRPADREADPDYHFLPFDGNFDYAAMMRKLDKYCPELPLMLEVFNSTRPEYKEMKPYDFVKTSYDRLVKISKM